MCTGYIQVQLMGNDMYPYFTTDTTFNNPFLSQQGQKQLPAPIHTSTLSIALWLEVMIPDSLEWEQSGSSFLCVWNVSRILNNFKKYSTSIIVDFCLYCTMYMLLSRISLPNKDLATLYLKEFVPFTVQAFFLFVTPPFSLAQNTIRLYKKHSVYRYN